MNPTPETFSPIMIYGLTTGVGVLGVLVGVIWKFIRDEQDRNRQELALKASSEALKESRAASEASLREARVDFKAQLERLHRDYQDRMHLLEQRQEREIELLNDRMNEIKTTISEMRKEQSNGTASILQHLQSITVAMRHP